MGQNLTRDFARMLQSWPAEDAGLDAVARLLLLDGLAVARAGAVELGPRLAGRMARQYGSHPASVVIGQGFSAAPAQAAQINGMAMHVLDYEPMWNPPNHAMSTILPGLLALAQVRESEDDAPQGARVLRALCKGIEAQGRLRLASGQLEPKDLTLHPPGVIGPIASAVACGDLLDLDQEQLVMAIGIAASRACGVLANVGSMTKALHCGDACRSGLEAATLALSGFTADGDALGGPRGYGQAYFGDRFDPAALLAPLVTPRVLDPGPAWKLFPSQYATHFAITAALDCRTAMGGAAAIRDVKITTPVMPYIDRPNPNSGLDGKFSYQYCVVAALLDGRINLATFSDQRRFSPDVAALLEHTVLSQTSAISGRFDAMHVDVSVTLVDGTQTRRRCAAPLGSWSRPIEPIVIEAKAHDLLDGLLDEQRANAFWSAMAMPTDVLRISDLMPGLA
ncbi:MAG TPA: MmgE/PrpD family protein [Paralcaligenes sp.]